MPKSRVLVTGAGGFIGFHLVRYLRDQGYWVRGVDIKNPEFAPSDADEFLLADLRVEENCKHACEGVELVYHLAADMGGIGYISNNHAEVARNNTLINVHMLDSARAAGVNRFLFSSTACVYPRYRQKEPEAPALKESDAYPADPEEGYGWEKLYTEKLCEYYWHDLGLSTRVVRFHNVYGPLGTYQGGKEKAPAAICRKVAGTADGGTIEVWGDGKQTRSFMYVDDCVEGIHRLMLSDYTQPLNLGTDESISINGLVELVARIAKKTNYKQHDLSKPQGVRGRNSDNTLLRYVLGWEPRIMLMEGIERTYPWIAEQVRAHPPEMDADHAQPPVIAPRVS